MPLSRREFLKKARRIKLIILDADGVLTDGSIIYGNTARRDFELKAFHVQDGFGISRAIRSGLPVCIITGRRSGLLARRAKELGIKEVYQGLEDKLPAYKRTKRRHRLTDSSVAFMGDDVPDLALLRLVGLSAATKNAVSEVKRVVDFVSLSEGGRGAVREFIDLILRAQGKI